MTEQEMEKVAKESYELLKILNEYKETERLLNEQKRAELQNHVYNIKNEYSIEAAVHNATHPDLPRTVEENGRNCLLFLKNLFVEKAAFLGVDLSKQ